MKPKAGERDVLRSLASRVRGLRQERGWSRAKLAERASLSVRFLAGVESGEGNISVLRLRDLARALGTGPDELLRPVEPVTGVVTLVGLRGAGKSTVGPILARRLAVPFVEMDDLVREAAGLPLDQIFELHGERHYRRLERDALESLLLRGAPSVLAAAGGVVNEPTNWAMLRRETTVAWLRATPEEHWNRVVAQGDRRPMADNPDAMAELRAILEARAPIYARADITVDTSARDPETIARTIADALGDPS
jgi:XRE family aerobic/anaerobic benzoate catabolism transcriptional regulator